MAAELIDRRAVSLLLVADLNLPVGRGIGTFGPREVAQVGRDAHLPASRLQNFYAQDMLAEPSRRAAGPSVTEAVAEAEVTVAAEIAVDVILALGRELVDTPRVLGPFEVEVFPEGSGPHIEHATPELADNVHCLLVVSGHSQRLKHVVPVESGESLRSAREQEVLAGRFGVHETRNQHNRAR